LHLDNVWRPVNYLDTETLIRKIYEYKHDEQHRIYRRYIKFQEIKLKSSSDIYEIASKLHPTPAISGFPKEKSISVIKKAEKHNRKYYCGIIGIKSKTEETYYVNLRCGEVTTTSIIAYAGGGITEGSNIDSEWKETEAKSESILGLI